MLSFLIAGLNGTGNALFETIPGVAFQGQQPKEEQNVFFAY